jgi:ABC-2 type transport system permease protein
VRDLASRHPSGSAGPLSLNFVARFNALLEDRLQSVTSILAVIILEVTLIIAAQSFTRERELGTLEQLRVTPLDHFALIVGKAIPTLLIGLVNALLMFGIVVLWLDVPLRGSLLLLMLLTLPFILAQVGWGTLISLISHTQQQATLFVFALAMLEVALSGFLVPASDMPGVVRVLSHASSVQHYLVVLRGIMLRGAGLGALWPQALALAGIGLAVSGMAWLRLRLGLGADSLPRRFRALWRARRHSQREQQPARSTSKGHESRPKKRQLISESP